MDSKDEKVLVSQKAVLYRDDGKILTIRRSSTAPTRPLFWDLPGGMLDYGEDIKDGMLREIREETGLEMENLVLGDAVSGVNDREEFWLVVYYFGKPTTFEPTLSYEHDDFKWVTPEEFQQLEASPRNKKFVELFAWMQKNEKF